MRHQFACRIDNKLQDLASADLFTLAESPLYICQRIALFKPLLYFNTLLKVPESQRDLIPSLFGLFDFIGCEMMGCVERDDRRAQLVLTCNQWDSYPRTNWKSFHKFEVDIR